MIYDIIVKYNIYFFKLIINIYKSVSIKPNLVPSFLLSYFSYKYGKNKKENEILKDNEELKRIFKDNTINGNNDLFNKLSKGNF